MTFSFFFFWEPALRDTYFAIVMLQIWYQSKAIRVYNLIQPVSIAAVSLHFNPIGVSIIGVVNNID